MSFWSRWSSSVDNERALSAEHKSGGDSDCTAPNRSAEEKQRNLHESRESYEEEEGGLRVASSDGEHSSCDDLRNERQTADIRIASSGENTEGAGPDEVAPSLSPHVEDGPPLLFTEVDEIPGRGVVFGES
uniref:CTNNB1_binding domain-containing protein n=1 Tax=Ascaris lumbricoides TaxID=6252 RepID=A0A0M3HNM6_ASCLU